MVKLLKKPTRRKTGPKAAIIKINGDWETAIDKALEKKRPPKGWPKHGKKPT